MKKLQVGKVTHYFSKIKVAVVKLIDFVKLGDEISFEGFSTDFKQVVSSIEVEHLSVEEGKPEQSVAIKVVGKVRPGDLVFKIIY